MEHEDIAAGTGGRTPEELPLRQPHRRATSGQRPLLLLPLLLALVLLSVSSVCSKFLPFGGADGGPNDMRLAAGASAEASAVEDPQWVHNDSDDCSAGATFALLGVDLVSYFSLAEGDEPVIGSPEHVASYGKFLFKFSSTKNKALFEESPATYLPAWGGFCSYGIPWEEGWSATDLGPPIDINQYLITSDGKLRFFRSETAKAVFLKNGLDLIAAGNTRWAGWFGEDQMNYPFDVSCFCSIDTC